MLGICAPAGHPAGDIAKSMSRRQQVHRCRAARKLLLESRDLVILHRCRNQNDELSCIMGKLILLFRVRR